MEIIREGGAKQVGGSTGGREIAMEIIREGGKSGGGVEIVSSRSTTTQVQVNNKVYNLCAIETFFKYNYPNFLRSLCFSNFCLCQNSIMFKL
jgi:hypothetical protein